MAQIKTLRVCNKMDSPVTFCVYQKNTANPKAWKSVAWLVKGCMGNVDVTFQWKEDLYFSWFSDGMCNLITKPSCHAKESIPANPFDSRLNSVMLTCLPPYGYKFARSDGDASFSAEGNLTIHCADTVPNNGAYVGLGMDEVATYVQAANSGSKYGAQPGNTYWITVGEYVQGAFIEASKSTIREDYQIIFPLNENFMELTFRNNIFSTPHSGKQ